MSVLSETSSKWRVMFEIRAQQQIQEDTQLNHPLLDTISRLIYGIPPTIQDAILFLEPGC